jgi:hypothetical protein
VAKHIERWFIDQLSPWARNPRTHSDAQLAQIAASIAEFGFNNPIWWIPNQALSPGTVIVLDRVTGRPRREENGRICSFGDVGSLLPRRRR